MAWWVAGKSRRRGRGGGTWSARRSSVPRPSGGGAGAKPLVWSGRLTIVAARSQSLPASPTNRPGYPASAQTRVLVENASGSAAVMGNAPSRSWEGGGRDHDGQQQSAGVDRDVPRAALCSSSRRRPRCWWSGRCRRRGRSRSRLRPRSALGRGRRPDTHVHPALGSSGTTPARGSTGGTGPRRSGPAGRRPAGPPGDLAADQGEDRVQDQAPVPLLGPAPAPAGAPRRREQRRPQRPLPVGHR
jgi:hypothetical protein